MPVENSDLIAIVIATLVSPLFLKLVEWTFNNASKSHREMKQQIDGLAKRVDELKASNSELALRSALQEQKIKDQAEEIIKLRHDVGERDKRIRELENDLQKLTLRLHERNS